MRHKRHPLSAIRDPGDRVALESAGLSSLDDVWRKIGTDKDRGIDELLLTAPADPSRLVRDLAEAAREESKQEQTPWLARHWLDLLLAIGALAFLVLGGRAISKASSVAIALRDLRAGEPLQAEALHGARGLDLHEGKSGSPGFRLTRDIPEGDYVFPKDLERLEVVARRPIPAAAVVPPDAVRLEWRTFRRSPAATLERVLGNMTTRAIPQDRTIQPQWLEAEPVLVDQVVAIHRLSRFHRITQEDLRLDRRTRQPGSFISLDQVIGRYPLQEVGADEVLRREGLSPGRLHENDLLGRQLLTLRVQPPSFRLAATLPARLSLAASSARAELRERQTLLVSQMPILAVESDGNGASVVAALTEAEIKDLLPLLPDAQIFVLQPPP